MSKRLGLLVLLGLLGCNSSPTTPPGVGDVTLDVVVTSVSGVPGIRAEVRNGRIDAVRHSFGCSFWGPGMQLFFLDATGRKLLLLDERALPECLDGIAVLEPGGLLEATVVVEGTLYTERGERVRMQPGRYTAVVGFGWDAVEDLNEDWHFRERRVEFRWPVP
jgi:hypothetical protein